MKTLFFIRSLNIGGAQRQLVNLAIGLRDRGHTLAVVTFYGRGALEVALKEKGIPVCDLGKRHRWDIFTFFNAFQKVIKREKPDIIYSYLNSANIVSVFLKPFFSTIRIVWGIRASNMDLSRYDWLARLEHKLAKRLSRYCDFMIVNSHKGCEYAISCGFQGGRMGVIHNGIDTVKFCPDPVARKQQRRKWYVSDQEALIGLAARLDPKKDHQTFLQAASILVRKNPDIRFVCIGDGPSEYRQRLKRLSGDLGLSSHLLWTGERQDMPRVFNALDLLCSSSAYGEGFPNAIGEAMACGIPCVVTDVGESAIIVDDLGEIVPPRQPEALAQGLKAMLKRLDKNAAALKKEVRDRIILHFHVEQMVSKTEKALAGLLT